LTEYREIEHSVVEQRSPTLCHVSHSYVHVWAFSANTVHLSFHFDFAIMGIFKRFWCVVWDNLYKTMKSMLYWTTKTINVFVHLLCSQYFTSVNSASETALHLPCLAMWLRGARLSSHEAILVLWYRDSKWWDR